MKLELLQTGILGVNTWIVPLTNDARENRVFIVDPASCSLTRDENKIIDFLEKRAFIPVAIFLTHGHFDHIMGIKSLKEKWQNLPICIFQDEADCIGSNSQIMQKKFLSSFGEGALDKNFLDALSNLPNADFVFNDNQTFDKIFSNFKINNCINNFSIDDAFLKALSFWRVIHTPGHTKGGCCFYNHNEKVLISGDTIFYGTYGRTDLFGGDEIEIKKSIQKLRGIVAPDTLVFPGHDYYGFKFNDCF